jgi:hypothetical protein
LTALDARQITALFASTRFDHPEAWTQALQDKIRQITSAGPCGS